MNIYCFSEESLDIVIRLCFEAKAYSCNAEREIAGILLLTDIVLQVTKQRL